MKIIILIPLYFIILLAISACQPGTAVRKESTAAIDSVLYFQQLDLNDPFLDTVFDDPDQPVTVEKVLIPPPVPPALPPRFKEIEGFRVQIFAGIDSINALPVVDQAAGLTPDSVYFFPDKGLFKIQIGDYQFRYKADSARTFFRQNGFPGAWIVQGPILIPIASDAMGVIPSMTNATGTTDLTGLESGPYKIQVMATNDAEKARLTAALLRSQNKYNAFYEQVGNLFKLFVGYFRSESQAREVLNKLRDGGYPDAWLVY